MIVSVIASSKYIVYAHSSIGVYLRMCTYTPVKMSFRCRIKTENCNRNAWNIIIVSNLISILVLLQCLTLAILIFCTSQISIISQRRISGLCMQLYAVRRGYANHRMPLLVLQKGGAEYGATHTMCTNAK